MWVVANQSNLGVAKLDRFYQKNEYLNDIFVNRLGTGTTKIWPIFFRLNCNIFYGYFYYEPEVGLRPKKFTMYGAESYKQKVQY